MKEMVLIVLVIALSACASDYPCGEPRSGRCSSVTNNYHNSLHSIVNPEDLPVNKHDIGCTNCSNASGDSSKFTSKYLVDNDYPQIPVNNIPLFSTPSMLRVWYAPFVDSDNIYHDQEYQYVITDRGHWLYETNRTYGRSGTSLDGNTLLVQASNSIPEETKPVASQSYSNSRFNTPGLEFLQQHGRVN